MVDVMVEWWVVQRAVMMVGVMVGMGITGVGFILAFIDLRWGLLSLSIGQNAVVIFFMVYGVLIELVRAKKGGR